jgi:hypothetical protein
MNPDFLGFLALHYDDLRAFVRSILRGRDPSSAFLRREAPRLQEGFPAARPLPWARRRLAAALADPARPLRRAAPLRALAEAFERRRDVRPDRGARLDAAIQGLSQDAQPALTARYENDLPLDTVAWRFRTTAEHAFGALVRIRRVLLQQLRGRIPHELCRVHELAQRHLESIASLGEERELAEAVARDPLAADLVAEAFLLDAELSAYFTADVDAPDEGATLALKLADRRRT